MIDKIPMPVQVHETAREPQNREQMPWEARRLVLMRTEDGNIWFLEDIETAQEKKENRPADLSENSSGQPEKETETETAEAKDPEVSSSPDETVEPAEETAEGEDPSGAVFEKDAVEEDPTDGDQEAADLPEQSAESWEESGCEFKDKPEEEKKEDDPVQAPEDPVPPVTRPFVSAAPTGSVSGTVFSDEVLKEEEKPAETKADSSENENPQPAGEARIPLQSSPDLVSVQDSVIQPQPEPLAFFNAGPEAAPELTLMETVTRSNTERPTVESKEMMFPEKTELERTILNPPVQEERIQVRTGSHLFDWEPESGLQVLKEAGASLPKLVIQDQPDCIEVRLDAPGQIITALVDGQDTPIQTDETGDTFIRLDKGTNVRTVQALTDSGQLVEKTVATGKAFDWTSLWPVTLLPLFLLKRLRHG